MVLHRWELSLPLRSPDLSRHTMPEKHYICSVFPVERCWNQKIWSRHYAISGTVIQGFHVFVVSWLVFPILHSICPVLCFNGDAKGMFTFQAKSDIFKMDWVSTHPVFLYHFVSQLRIVKSLGFHLEKPPDPFDAVTVKKKQQGDFSYVALRGYFLQPPVSTKLITFVWGIHIINLHLCVLRGAPRIRS